MTQNPMQGAVDLGRIDIRERGPRPADRWGVEYAPGRGYFVTDPRGRKVTGYMSTRGEVEDRRDRLRLEAAAKAKRGKRTCLCCRHVFDSDGIHNRLCQPCKSRGYATWGGV